MSISDWSECSKEELVTLAGQALIERDIAAKALEEISAMGHQPGEPCDLATGYKYMNRMEIANIFVTARRAISRMEMSHFHFNDVREWLTQEQAKP